MGTMNYVDLAASNLVFAVVVFAAAVALLLFSRTWEVRGPYLRILAVAAIGSLAVLITWQTLLPGWILALSFLIAVTLPAILARTIRGLSFAGNLLMAAHVNVGLAGLLWGFSIVATAEVGSVTRTLMWIGFAVAALTLVVGLVQTFEQWEVICRRDWRRARTAEVKAVRSHYPRVSLHVPTYSEPPELVISTLNTLSAMQYPNFEVLVIDNNTSDPSLWRPVEAHCARLGTRFRFFHIDRLPGAKAGALNFALRHSDAEAELIGVIDSDYQVQGDFLTALVGYFDDPRMGFVQTPQSYRDWGPHHYLRMCNWEYNLVFATTLVSRNERMAALTVGTMGLIRRSVLDEVGGWAEWCLTEDSELSVRIHAAGYRSMYINTVYGKGLVPETFEDYKRQRFRWTYGPIQELRRHFRLFLPGILARRSALTPAQKTHHLIHGLGALKSGFELLLLPLGGLTVGSMVLHGETVTLPSYIWPTLGVAAIAAFALKWHLFRASMACSFRDMLGAMMATMALDYVVRIASLRGLFTRNTPWRRTNKFRALPLGLGALGSAMDELMLGVLLIAAGAGVAAASHLPNLFRLIAVGWVMQGGQFLIAPLMAVLAEYGIRQRARVDDEQPALSTDVQPRSTDT